MKLYYAPGACSLACRIALHEAGFAAEFEQVDLKAKTTERGHDYTAINPKGYVPMLVLDDGTAITENTAILDFIAERDPLLGPAGPLARTRLIEMLSWFSTELHVAFKPFWHAKSGADAVLAEPQVRKRLELVAGQVREHHLFGSRFTVADAYLFVMLRWAMAFGLQVPLELMAYFERVAKRSTVRRALAEEGLPEVATGPQSAPEVVQL